MRLTDKVGIDYIYSNYVSLEEPHKSIANKLGQLEDIEDELGIELSVLFKAFKDGIYINVKENNNGVDKIVFVQVGGIVWYEDDQVFRLTNADRYDGAFWGTLATTKNYGTIWALTKEELIK